MAQKIFGMEKTEKVCGITIYDFLSTISCFTVSKFFVGKSFLFQKMSSSEINYKKQGGWGCHVYVFLPEVFCLTVSLNYMGEPFCVSEDFWFGKKIKNKCGVLQFSVQIN